MTGKRYQSEFGATAARSTPARGRRGRVLAAVAVAVVACVLAAARFKSIVAPSERRIDGRSGTFLGFDPAAGRLPSPARIQPASVAGLRARAPSHADGQVEICGIGLVRTTADDPDGGTQVPAVARDDAAQSLFQALIANPDARARAAGRLLRLRAARTDAPGEDAPVLSAVLDQLVQSATYSQDPVVYATALEACAANADTPSTSCSTLSAARWASLEPANAAPWLRLAQEARDAGDEQALASAIYQISLAKRVDWHDDDLAVAALKAMPKDATPLARMLDVRAISQARDGWQTPAYGGLAAFCAPGANANDDQLCDAAANLLVRPDARPYEARLGTRMGQGLGWPPSRIEQLRLEREALGRSDRDSTFDDPPYSCDAADHLRQWAALRSQLGELGGQRVLMAGAGQRLEDAVAQLRRQRADRMARLAALGDGE